MTTTETHASKGRAAEQDSPLKEAGSQLKESGRQFADRAKDEAKQAVERRKGAAAEYVKALSAAAESGARDLEGKGFQQSADLVSRGAREVESLAEGLRQRGPEQLFDDLQGFAQRSPWLFFGLTLAAGFGATRYFRSTGRPVAPASASQAPAGTTVGGTV